MGQAQTTKPIILVVLSLSLWGCGMAEMGSSLETPRSAVIDETAGRRTVELVDVEALKTSGAIYAKNWTIFEAPSGRTFGGYVYRALNNMSGRSVMYECALLSASEPTLCVVNGYVVHWMRMNYMWLDRYSTDLTVQQRYEKFHRPYQICSIESPQSLKVIAQWMSESHMECLAEATKRGINRDAVESKVSRTELEFMYSAPETVEVSIRWGDFREPLRLAKPGFPLQENCSAIEVLFEKRTVYPTLGKSFQLTKNACEEFCLDVLEKHRTKTIQCQMHYESVRLLVPVTNRLPTP